MPALLDEEFWRTQKLALILYSQINKVIAQHRFGVFFGGWGGITSPRIYTLASAFWAI